MNPRERCIKELKKLHFVQIEGTKHDRFYNAELKYAVTVSRSSHFDEDDMRMILQEVKREMRRQGKE